MRRSYLRVAGRVDRKMIALRRRFKEEGESRNGSPSGSRWPGRSGGARRAPAGRSRAHGCFPPTVRRPPHARAVDPPPSSRQATPEAFGGSRRRLRARCVERRHRAACSPMDTGTPQGRDGADGATGYAGDEPMAERISGHGTLTRALVGVTASLALARRDRDGRPHRPMGPAPRRSGTDDDFHGLGPSGSPTPATAGPVRRPGVQLPAARIRLARRSSPDEFGTNERHRRHEPSRHDHAGAHGPAPQEGDRALVPPRSLGRDPGKGASTRSTRRSKGA